MGEKIVQKSYSLDDVAKEENWIEFGNLLARVMEDPGSYGLRSPGEALQKIADIKGKRAHSLKNSMKASQWLKNNNPEVFDAKPVWLGMTLVMFLMKIDELDPLEAKNIAPKVFGGQSNQVELKQKYDELREKKRKSASGGNIELSAPERGQLFNEEVEKYLEKFGAQLFKAEEVIVRPGKNIDPIGADLLITLKSGERIAVEVKSHRTRVDRHLAISTLGILALIQRNVPEVLMIAPEGSAYDFRKMIDLRNKLSLKGIRFATLPERGAAQLEDLKLFG